MAQKNRHISEEERKAKKLAGKTFTLEDIDPSILDVFEYEYPQQDIDIEYCTDEFTCICPYSGLPDFAHLSIFYKPVDKCIELKSLKYYLYSFRQVKSFNEHVVNRILQDLVKLVSPRYMKISGEFTVRGGIKAKVEVSYTSAGGSENPKE